MEFKQLATYIAAAILAWGGLTLVSHSEDIASSQTDFEYIKSDISEIKHDIRDIKAILQTS